MPVHTRKWGTRPRRSIDCYLLPGWVGWRWQAAANELSGGQRAELERNIAKLGEAWRKMAGGRISTSSAGKTGGDRPSLGFPAEDPSDSINRQARDSAAAAGRRTLLSRLIVPREHGAWGMVAVPLVVAVFVAGGWWSLHTLGAALAVLAVFLLRAPLLVVWRRRGVKRPPTGSLADALPMPSARDTKRHNVELHTVELADAWLSIAVYAAVAVAAGGYQIGRAHV